MSGPVRLARVTARLCRLELFTPVRLGRIVYRTRDYVVLRIERSDGVVGQGVREQPARVVGRDVVSRVPRLRDRVVPGEHPRRQPPQRPRQRMTVEDPPARRDETRRIESERRQRGGRFPHEHFLGSARRPSDVPETLDRMHGPRRYFHEWKSPPRHRRASRPVTSIN